MVPGVSWNLHPASNSRPLCTCAGQCSRPAGWTVIRPRRLNCRRWSQHTCHAQQDDNNNPGTLQAAAAAKAFGVRKAARYMQTHLNHNFRKSCADEAFHLMPEVWSQVVCLLHGLCVHQGPASPTCHQQPICAMPAVLLLSMQACQLPVQIGREQPAHQTESSCHLHQALQMIAGRGQTSLRSC